MTGNFKEDRLYIFWNFTKVIQTVPINFVALPKIAEKFRKSPRLPRQIRQPSHGCYWQVSDVLRTATTMHYKHTHLQGINIDKADEWIKAYHWKTTVKKNYRSTVSQLYLLDVINWILQQLCLSLEITMTQLNFTSFWQCILGFHVMSWAPYWMTFTKDF